MTNTSNTFAPSTLNGQELPITFAWAVLARINPNAHNTRYGRDCHAPAVVRAVIWAFSAEDALDEAMGTGITYNPEVGEYHWLGERAVKLPHD